MQLLMSVTIDCNASREIKLYSITIKILPDGIGDAHEREGDGANIFK